MARDCGWPSADGCAAPPATDQQRAAAVLGVLVTHPVPEVRVTAVQALLSTLAAMLRSHVTSALGVDLVGEGRDVVARCAEVDVDAAASNGGKRGRRPAITVHQVSNT